MMIHSPFSVNIKVSWCGVIGWSGAVCAVWLMLVQCWIQNNGNYLVQRKVTFVFPYDVLPIGKITGVQNPIRKGIS